MSLQVKGNESAQAKDRSGKGQLRTRNVVTTEGGGGRGRLSACHDKQMPAAAQNAKVIFGAYSKTTKTIQRQKLTAK